MMGYPPPDFWEQWRSILWLRWRLSRNQWRRRGLFDRISFSILFVLAGVLILLSAVGGFIAGTFLAGAPPSILPLVFDGVILFFLFFWVVGLLTEIQRSESLDISKLLHLPVSLGRVFAFNYASSWVSLSILITLPALVAMSAGLAVSRGPLLLMLVPVIAGFFFVTTAGTYLLRGWLVSLMSNERRRRAIIVTTSVLAVLFFQLPNFYFNVMRERPGLSKAGVPGWMGAARVVLPPLWVGASASSLSRGDVRPALGAALGLGSLGVLALVISHRGTLRALRGTNRPMKPKKEKLVRPSRMVSREIPGIPPEAAAVALATLRSHLRAPEVKMALFGQVVMTLVFGFLLFRSGGKAPPFQKLGAGPLLATLSLVGATQLLFNQFGFDRDGFRSYLLAPVSRSHILFGKTLAAFPLVAGTGFLILLFATGFGFLAPEAFLSAVLTLFAGYLLFSILGSWLSIVAPYKIAAGSLRPTKVPPRVTFLIFAGMLVSPLAGAVLFLPTMLELAGHWLGWPEALPLKLAGSCLLAGVAGGLYALTLPPLGRLLERREIGILSEVTREIE